MASGLKKNNFQTLATLNCVEMTALARRLGLPAPRAARATAAPPGGRGVITVKVEGSFSAVQVFKASGSMFWQVMMCSGDSSSAPLSPVGLGKAHQQVAVTLQTLPAAMKCTDP